jgi:hypothetical protein
VTVTTDKYGICTPATNASGWADYRAAFSMMGVNRDATAIIGVRQSQYGRAEVAVGESSVVVRQMVNGEWSDAGRLDGLKATGGHTCELTVSGDRLTVTLPDQPPMTVVLHPKLRSGSVVLGVAARAPGTAVTFVQQRFEEVR